MPLQYLLTAEAQKRIQQSDNAELQGIPVGQIVGSLNDVEPVSAVMHRLTTELESTLDRLSDMSGKARP
jgi:NAD(P)H-dependent flavin oxidoreductase YrpB (nitropropane dioxygenase family)